MSDDDPGSEADEDPSDDLPDEPLADLAADVREQMSDQPTGDDRPSAVDEGDAEELPPLPGETSPGADREGPLGDLAAEIDRRRAGDADDDIDDLFTAQDVADLDVDAIWEQVESGGVDAEFDGVDADERVISKAGYCQQCEFFSEPPAVACGHDGTEILELVDTDSFRVRNCPKVAEEERLGDL